MRRANSHFISQTTTWPFGHRKHSVAARETAKRTFVFNNPGSSNVEHGHGLKEVSRTAKNRCEKKVKKALTWI
jgi:hypothetical protein